MNCELHPDQQLTWVCLEARCGQRVMCSRCAVKSHSREHKLEELQTVVSSGILSSFSNNPSNLNRVSLIQNQNSNESLLKSLLNWDADQKKQQLLSLVELSINKVENQITSLREQLIQQVQYQLDQEENQRVQVLEQLTELQSGLVSVDSTNDLTNIFNSGFDLINAYSAEQQQKINENENSSTNVMLKKLNVLTRMKDSFFSITQMYFDNSFIKDLVQLYEMQLQTLIGTNDEMNQEFDIQSIYENQKNLQEPGSFMVFLQDRWKQDYNNIQYTLNKFTVRLSEGLKYTINMPLEKDQSPQKRFHQQQQTSLPSPMYHNQQYQQYQMGQGQILKTPQMIRDPILPVTNQFGIQYQLQNDLAHSQIIYDDYVEAFSPLAYPINIAEIQPIVQKNIQKENIDDTSNLKRVKENNKLFEQFIERTPGQQQKQNRYHQLDAKSQINIYKNPYSINK